MVSQDLEAVIHAEGEHVAVVGGHRVVIAAVGTVGVGVLGRKREPAISQQQLDAGRTKQKTATDKQGVKSRLLHVASPFCRTSAAWCLSTRVH